MTFEFVSSKTIKKPNLYKRMAEHQVKKAIAEGNQQYGAAIGAALLGDDNLSDDFLNTF
jgi:hypothetical protein